MSGKRQHYILPLMPAMAILVGILLDDMVFCRRTFNADFVRRIGKAYIYVVIVAIVGGIIAAAVLRPQFLAGVIVICLFAAVMGAVIVVLFYKGMHPAALAGCFVYVTLGFMVYIRFDARYVDDSREVKEFSIQITSIVPKTEKLVAFKNISSTFVHYYGRVVPKIYDIEELYKHYEQGDWILATSDSVKPLEKDGRFKQTRYKPGQPELRRDASGALFHKSDN